MSQPRIFSNFTLNINFKIQTMNLLSITNAFIRMIKHRMLVESTTSFLLCITQGNRKIQILSMYVIRV